jgi:pyrimidine-nucleoside phosphorylase
MDAAGFIRRKRAGDAHTEGALRDFVVAAVAGTVPEYQLTAWLMAVMFNGLSVEETVALTRAFVYSGRRLSWPAELEPTVDKHSTGGVGDKVSLLLLPWLAATGVRMPKMSGRGLGHTGGTIDKLESIPGFRVNLEERELLAQLRDVGCADIAQSTDLVPADKLFYALRDATDTVERVELIVASVVSKKIAAGASCIVLDVKCGAGAFFPDIDAARAFAVLARKVAAAFDRRCSCVISAMDEPLGWAVGNALEVQEALQALRGIAFPADLIEVCATLGAVALVDCGMEADVHSGRQVMLKAFESGAVWERAQRWIAAQGGSLSGFAERLETLRDYRRIELWAESQGVVQRVEPRLIGELVRSLGGGRLRAGATIDPLVGVVCHAKVDAACNAGDLLATAYASAGDSRSDSEIRNALAAAYSLGSEKADPAAVVLEVLQAG